MPPEARWPHLKESTIGQLVDDAMAGIERDNPALDKQLMSQIVELSKDPNQPS